VEAEVNYRVPGLPQIIIMTHLNLAQALINFFSFMIGLSKQSCSSLVSLSTILKDLLVPSACYMLPQSNPPAFYYLNTI
jgi:hypothetical protein